MATVKYSRPLGARITLEEPTFAQGAFEAYTAERDRDERERDKILNQANLDRTRQDTLKRQSIMDERYAKAELDKEEQTKREDWDIMYQAVTDPADRERIIQSGIDDNVRGVDLGLLDVAKNARIKNDNINAKLKNYYSADDNEKLNLAPELISILTESGAPAKIGIAAKIEKNTKDLQNRVDNKEIANMMVSSYPNVFKGPLKSYLESSSSFSNEQLDMVKSMLEQNMKAARLSSTQKADLASKLMAMQTKGDMPTQEQRNMVERANALGFRLNQDLGIFPDNRPPDKKIDFPTLESIDDDATGADNSFDSLSEDDKKIKFAEAVEKIIPGGKEAFNNMSMEERNEQGQKIIEEINKTTYIPKAKKAGFKGFEYSDPEPAKTITEDMIQEKIKEVMERGRVPEKQQSDKRILSQARKTAIRDLKRELQKQSRKRVSSVVFPTFPQKDLQNREEQPDYLTY